MLIKAYGLFWRADEVDWQPGRGSRVQFRLLGRRGSNRGSLEIVNFRRQQGLYVLYNDYGPYYVGLVRDGTLGSRLRAHHLRDRHAGNWDRFSWFGFCQVLRGVDEHGLRRLRMRAEQSVGSSRAAIADMEAVLIKALGTESNLQKMRFAAGMKWTQVTLDEVEGLLLRLGEARRSID